MSVYKLSYLESGKPFYGEPPYVVRVDSEGIVSIVSQDNPGYLAWLAEGNTAEEWTGS